ncbi:MAG: hypothetical protein Q9182_007023 [Xanthomendoza sp. 2 TL-2023]
MQTSISSLLPHFRTSLISFSSSPSTFLVLHTLPTTSPAPSCLPLKSLHILDSSFNPPTLAHFRIALSALKSTAKTLKPQRLLLLLATQNADKAPKPATFEQRLAMMTLLAQTILDHYHSTGSSPPSPADEKVAIDIGIIKKPYFHDKAIAIEQSEFYKHEASGEQPQQVHLLGFDSLIRLMDTKYYPPTHSLAPISGLFNHHRIRVTRRTEEGNKYGTAEEQDRIREALASGAREEEGAKREWAERIEMVEGEGEAVSSTQVREAVGRGEWAAAERLVGKRVMEWVETEGLYKKEDEVG